MASCFILYGVLKKFIADERMRRILQIRAWLFYQLLFLVKGHGHLEKFNDQFDSFDIYLFSHLHSQFSIS